VAASPGTAYGDRVSGINPWAANPVPVAAGRLLSSRPRLDRVGIRQVSDPCDMTAEELAHAFARRRLSPVEATRAAFDRIRRADGALNAFSMLDEDGALATARASERRHAEGRALSEIDGVPTTIKGLSPVQGWPNRRGSRATDDAPSEEDSSSVASLRAAGAVFLGLTTTPEFGWKGLTDSPLTGVTRNPWDTARTPGGSSGGAAVAAACGFGALHQGSDGAGSVRIPAAFTGVFGIKASFGRVPAYPASPFRTVSHIGPLTRGVRDAALMLNILQRADPRDPTALPAEPGRDWRQGIEDGVRGLRIAYSRTLGGRARVHPDVAARVEAAARTLSAIGAEVEEVEPDLPDHAEAMLVLWSTAAARLRRLLPADRLDRLDPGLAEMMEIGAGFTVDDLYAADATRMALGRAMGAFHARYDALITPTMPIPAFVAGQDLNEPGQRTWMDWSPFSYPFNMTGQPAASIPCGFARDGLPVGLQIVGPLHGEAVVLRVARAYERAMPAIFPPPPG
jgi:aspartyl-tRNA(Asn)/glutamyl-tRNA(Gln) amidotransferase subunit A